MDAKKKLSESSNGEISRLFKMMLIMVEDMKKDHDFHYEKLYENIPQEYHKIIDTANHFTPQKVKLLDLFQLCFRNSVRNWSISINSGKYLV